MRTRISSNLIRHCRLEENYVRKFLEPLLQSCTTQRLGILLSQTSSVRISILVVTKTAKTFLKLTYLTNKEASTVFCSAVKHAGSGRARKKCRGKHETQSSVFPHSLSALPLPKCFTTEQNTVEASLFVL